MANKKIAWFKIIGMLLLLFSSIVAIAQNIPPRPQPARLVNDFADLLDNSEENQLESKLRNYMDSTSTQIVVVTVNSIDGAPVNEYAASIGYKWGIGQKDKHNGVVILISKNDRKGYIATGYGVEDGLNNFVANDIYKTDLVPYFKTGNFYRGLDEGTSAIILVLSGKFSNEHLLNKNEPDSTFVIILVIAILLFFIFIAWIAKKNGNHISRRGVSSPTFWGPTIGGGGGFFDGGGRRGGGNDFGGFDFGGGDFSGGGAGGDW